MQALAAAIERKQWELAALCLLLGLTEAAAKLPPEAIEGLLEVLVAEDGPSGRKARSRRGRAH
jgi:hypothetical protein